MNINPIIVNFDDFDQVFDFGTIIEDTTYSLFPDRYGVTTHSTVS